ncbi:polysaccharide deacetylase [Thermococcus chitonophagus]|uniref:Polysaccharide deacetylase n=1 Tax=Thermococcus chitonophagus TaxID=54262 RepID=A0A160VTF1_9EURY|nr:DUF2334 domain-containing protein [Thermococcus chitonophagus]ASJ15633.1 polysaccharide deacetylase [Thermococcus chitonophagus]CUX76841.1 Uncharacterized protein MJ0505 [Thermococcus chitonophagus]
MKKVIPLILIGLLIASLIRLTYSPCQSRYTGSFMIIVHDVSPVYTSDIRKIVDVLKDLGYQNSTMLFIIPNHAGNHPISRDKNFAKLIRELEKEGFKVGIHGYTHSRDEFNCNSSVAEAKIEEAIGEMHKANISFEKVFIPPEYSISQDALKVLLKNNFTVILKDKIYYPNGSCAKIANREYTWYASNWSLGIRLFIAKLDYRLHSSNFVLSIHPKAVNYGCGMEFLRKFLKWLKLNVQKANS